MQIYLVGGAVRDQLLSRVVKDKDYVVVGATPQQMLDKGYQQVGKDFPVFLHPQTKEEYALARTERKTRPGYQGFTFNTDTSVTLEEDLKRRDLTINAIAQADDGTLVDPYNGQQDLQNAVLRHVSPAFTEDPVRVLRVARFMARYAELGFTVADETLQLMRDMVRNGEVKALVSERVWQEFDSALTEPEAHQFFRVLRSVGALNTIMPEIDHMFGVPLDKSEHPEVDCGEHAMLALQKSIALGAVPMTRFSAIMPGLGKVKTDPSDWPQHNNFIESSLDLIKSLCDRLRVPSDYKELALITAEHQVTFSQICNLDADLVVDLLERVDAFRRRERFLKFSRASLANLACHANDDLRQFSHLQCLEAKLKRAADVDVQDIIKKGFKGEDIKIELHKARVEAIS